MQRVTEDSIRLWEQRTAEYVAVVTQNPAAYLDQPEVAAYVAQLESICAAAQARVRDEIQAIPQPNQPAVIEAHERIMRETIPQLRAVPVPKAVRWPYEGRAFPLMEEFSEFGKFNERCRRTRGSHGAVVAQPDPADPGPRQVLTTSNPTQRVALVSSAAVPTVVSPVSPVVTSVFSPVRTPVDAVRYHRDGTDGGGGPGHGPGPHRLRQRGRLTGRSVQRPGQSPQLGLVLGSPARSGRRRHWRSRRWPGRRRRCCLGRRRWRCGRRSGRGRGRGSPHRSARKRHHRAAMVSTSAEPFQSRSCRM